MPDIVCFKDGTGRWLESNDFNISLFQLQGIAYQGKKESELAVYQIFLREAFLGCEESDERAWLAGHTLRSEEIIPGSIDAPTGTLSRACGQCPQARGTVAAEQGRAARTWRVSP